MIAAEFHGEIQKAIPSIVECLRLKNSDFMDEAAINSASSIVAHRMS